MDDAVDCSILTPVYNEERYIEQTVAAMRAQRFDGRIEFLFVDGRSQDRTREILERLGREDPRIRVLDNPGRTVPSGLNVALSAARGTWVARMDAHTVYPDDYIALGVARLRHGGTSWVSGSARPAGDGAISRAVALALGTPLGRGASRKWTSGDAAEGSADEGAADELELDTGVFGGVWERVTLLEYGGWDERWPRNSDSEMAARFLERGQRLVCLPAMAATYSPRSSLRGLWRQYRGYGRYRVMTGRHHPASMRPSHLLTPAVVANTAAAVVAPRPVRRLARLGCALYLGALVFSAVEAGSRARRPTDAALVPVVLAVMHFANGIGTIEGATINGPPLASLAAMAGLDQLAARVSPPPSPVHAPSLAMTSPPAGTRIG